MTRINREKFLAVRHDLRKLKHVVSTLLARQPESAWSSCLNTAQMAALAVSVMLPCMLQRRMALCTELDRPLRQHTSCGM